MGQRVLARNICARAFVAFVVVSALAAVNNSNRAFYSIGLLSTFLTIAT